MRVRTWLLSVLSLFAVIFVSPVGAQKSYTLAMLPRYFPEKIEAMMRPMGEYLSSKTGLSVTPIFFDDFQSYEEAVLKGKVDLGYQNPLVYVKVGTAHEVIAMAVKGEGGDKFRGIAIVRPDSPFGNLRDLVGKKVMIVGPTSAGGFLSQKISARDQGIDVDKDYELSVAARNQQENVIIAVSVGDVDGGFIRESALHVADRYIMPGSVKVLTETAWLPNWAFSVKRDMPVADREALLRALTALPESSAVLQAMELTQIKPAGDGEYDIMRSILVD